MSSQITGLYLQPNHKIVRSTLIYLSSTNSINKVHSRGVIDLGICYHCVVSYTHYLGWLWLRGIWVILQPALTSP